MYDMSLFSSALAISLVRFLRHKQALGREYRAEYFRLRNLDHYLARRNATDLNTRIFLSWCETKKHVASGVRRADMLTVRAYCLYRRRSEPDCYVPDTRLFPHQHVQRSPYIFTEAEIRGLLNRTSDLRRISHTPLRLEATRLILVLLYCAGLRIGELLRLDVDDYDSAEQTLYIRSSKFHKSRKIPLSPDAVFELKQYLTARQQLSSRHDVRKRLVWNGSGQGDGYSVGRFRLAIAQLLDREEICDCSGNRPTIHSLRHTFAVHALLRWYRCGVDLKSKLPQLAIYMGHVSIISTAKYLHFVDELVSAASTRFASHAAKILGAPVEITGDPS